jgi:hypothetical protein
MSITMVRPETAASRADWIDVEIRPSEPAPRIRLIQGEADWSQALDLPAPRGRARRSQLPPELD